MRILMWAGGYPPDLGGVEAVVQELAGRLTDRGHAVAVITQSAKGASTTERRREATVHRLPFHQVLSRRDPDAIGELTRQVTAVSDGFRPDVIHVHAVHPHLFFLLRTIDSGSRVIFTLHGWTTMASGIETIRMRMMSRADWLTGCSRHVVDRIVAATPAAANRTLTIYNGCRVPAHAPSALPFRPPRLVSVGRLVDSKGIDVALQALAELLPAYPGLRLRIVGDGPLRQQLEAQAEMLDVASSTEFVGAVPPEEVGGHIEASTLLVMPSRGGSEGLPLAALEAAVRERPVVGTCDGGLVEAVVDGVTGFLVQDCNPTSIARSIRRVLDDRELAVSMGRAGRAHATERFAWDAQVDAYAALYARAAGETSRDEH